MSNAGPLTTTFTAPSSCATATGLYQIWPASGTYYYEQGPLLSNTNCYPGGYDASPSQYYSPGLCPSGYTPACSSTGVVSTTVTETAYTCCPTAADYTCAGQASDALLASSGSQTWLGCTTTFDQALVLASVTAILSNGSTSVLPSTTESAGVGLGANSIAVRFQSGDFNSGAVATGDLASTTDASIASATKAVLDTATLAIPVPTSTNSSSNPSASEQRHAGITTTQAIGIGVGSAALALIAAGTAGLLLWLRRRKQKIRAQIETPIPPPAPPPKDRKYRAPPPLKLDRSSHHSNSSSGIASVARSVNGKMIRGPFELQTSHGGGKGGGDREKDKGGSGGLYRIYGAQKQSHHHPNHHQQRQHSLSQIRTPNSSDPLRPNAAPPPFWSPPPSYGFQPAELESPQRSVTSAGSGFIRGRAELASP